MANIKNLVILLLLVSCSNNIKKTSSLDLINISDALKNTEEVKLSQFIQSIEYVHLEESNQTFLYYPLIEVTDDYIIARNSGPSAMGPILLFDRKTGKFVRAVGKSGRGPEEFQMGNLTIYNIYKRTLYAIGYNNDIKEYDTDGKFVGSFKLPVMIDEKVAEKFGTPGIHLDQYLNKKVFVACIQNNIGWDKRRIVLFTRDSIIKIFPNYLFWERKDWKYVNSFGMNPSFFRWEDKLNVKEEFNDTIFQITTNSLIPRFIFQLRGLNPPLQLQEQSINFEKIAKYYFINQIFENSYYLFFQLGYGKNVYTGFFNKTTKKTTICKLQDTNKSAFLDDINGFMQIRPQKITQNNEMIFKLEAMDIIKWIKENPEKVKTFGKNMDWLKTISEASNPVIVIAKFKD